MHKLIPLIVILLLLLAACGGDDANDNDRPTRQFDPNTPAGRGESVFQTRCSTCHTVTGDRVIVGPTLAGIGTIAETRIADMSAAEYLYESIVNPDDYLTEGFAAGTMQQNFGDQLSPEAIDDLVTYLLALK